MSVKNRKGGFLPLRFFTDTPCRTAQKHTLPVGRVIGARLLRRSPCPRGVASETGGVGASPRKASPIKQLEPQAGEAAHFASEAANSREARGGIGDKREGGVPTAPPRRECGANLRASSSQCSKQQSFTDCLAFDETPSTNPRTRINPPMSEHVAQIGTGVCRISSLNTIKGQEPET